MSIKEFFHKIHFRIRYPFSGGTTIFSEYNTWYFYFLDFIPLLKNKIVEWNIRNGTKYFLRLNAFDQIVLNEMYILKEYKSLYRYIKPRSTVIDVGAHIGFFSVLAARLNKDVKVISFEPFSENYSLLVKNVGANSLKDRVKTFPLGVGAKREKRKLYIHAVNSGGHSLYKKSNKSISINLVSLQEVFRANNITVCDFLKMDCEGAEYEILMHTPDHILRKIKCIALEHHANEDSKMLESFLEKKGFTVSRPKDSYFPLIFAVRGIN